MGMMALRIPNEMRRAMRYLKINWPDYLRESIKDALGSEKKRDLIQRLHRLVGRSRQVKSGTAAMIIRRLREHA